MYGENLAGRREKLGPNSTASDVEVSQWGVCRKIQPKPFGEVDLYDTYCNLRKFGRILKDDFRDGGVGVSLCLAKM